MIPERIRAPLPEQTQDEQEEDLQEDVPPVFNESDEELEEPENEEQVEMMGAFGNEDPTEQLGIQGWESDHGADDDADLALYREEESAIDRSLQAQSPERPAAKRPSTKKTKELRISKRGLEYPSFPAASVKKLTLGFMKSQGSKAQLNKDTLAALVRVTDDFFEQIGIDLAAYAQHGGRKMIEESDVIALMKRYVTFISVQTFTPIYANDIRQNAQDFE
jgi:histone H3/H4